MNGSNAALKHLIISKGIGIRLTTELASSIIVFDNRVLIQPFREFHNKNGGCGVSNECLEDVISSKQLREV